MRFAKSAWFIWLLYGVAVLGALSSPLLAWNSPAHHTAGSNLVRLFTSVLYPLVFGVVGALILSRQARNRIGWLLMVIALSISISGALEDYLGRTVSDATSLTGLEIFGVWLSMWSWWWLIGPFLIILLIFPTGQLLSPRWRWVVGLVGLLFIVFLSLATLTPEWATPNLVAKVPNPLNLKNIIPANFDFDALLGPWVIVLVSTAGLCVLSVIIRYQRSRDIEREQLKWFMFAGLLFIMMYIGSGLLGFGEERPVWIGLLFDIVLQFLPISIGIAILRYRLFDIDIIIRRTLQYSLLSGLLGLTYFGLITVLQSIFRSISNQQSEISIVLSTLVIAALFFPLRNRVQEFIDKRFYRRKYDAQKVIADFAATCRDETDLDKLVLRLEEVIDETLQPEKVSVWIKDDAKLKSDRAGS